MSSLCHQVINAAANQDREGVLQRSRDMKFLTGYESKVIKCLYSKPQQRHFIKTFQHCWFSPVS